MRALKVAGELAEGVIAASVKAASKGARVIAASIFREAVAIIAGVALSGMKKANHSRISRPL